MSITSIRLQQDIETPLAELAKKLDRSKNYLINQAIKEYIARQTLEESRWADTLEALDSIKSGKSVSEQEVHEWLASWGDDNEKAPPKA